MCSPPYDLEFAIIIFAVIYAFSIIFFCLAVLNKMMGKKYWLWNWIIGRAVQFDQVDPRLTPG
jgi:Na+/glutamate symporter